MALHPHHDGYKLSVAYETMLLVGVFTALSRIHTSYLHFRTIFKLNQFCKQIPICELPQISHESHIFYILLSRCHRLSDLINKIAPSKL